MDENQTLLDLSGNLYVLGTDNPEIPALQLDRVTGTYAVLVFTSETYARRYCHHRNPDLISSIKKLSKKRFRGSLHQAGLIKIARAILKSHNHYIKSFVFDHPGTRGPANIASLEDVIKLGRFSKEAQNKKESNELKDFLDNQE